MAEESNKVTITFELSKDFIKRMDEVHIPKENRKSVFENWVYSALGKDYGTDFDQFDDWMDESDNYIDFVEFLDE